MNDMSTKKNLGFAAALAILVGVYSATAAGTGGPGPGGPGGNTNDTNSGHFYYNSTNYYQNHYLSTNGAGWFTNMAQWSNAPVPNTVANRHQVLPLSQRTRQNGPLTPADVQVLVQQFQQDREAFMQQWRALEQQMSSATEQNRQKIREQLKEQMEQWKQQQAQVREQLQAQADRMREQLRDHSRLVDRVSNPGTTSGGSSDQNGTGPRGRP